MQTYLWIALGSALGGVMRFAISAMLAQRFGEKAAIGTLLVNVTGSFLIGLLAAVSAKNESFHAATGLRQFLMIGVCGGYTTFSAFSLQTMEMLKAGEIWQSGLYVAGSVVLCIGAAVVGYFVGQIAAR
ncbi:MAG: fluoride efflux transporter CrcB [Verrucomicrobia bacterium]|nr:fluoride efflux transporter CrcB [Verrucomicrobiota bacterium]